MKKYMTSKLLCFYLLLFAFCACEPEKIETSVSKAYSKVKVKTSGIDLSPIELQYIDTKLNNVLNFLKLRFPEDKRILDLIGSLEIMNFDSSTTSHKNNLKIKISKPELEKTLENEKSLELLIIDSILSQFFDVENYIKADYLALDESFDFSDFSYLNHSVINFTKFIYYIYYNDTRENSTNTDYFNNLKNDLELLNLDTFISDDDLLHFSYTFKSTTSKASRINKLQNLTSLLLHFEHLLIPIKLNLKENSLINLHSSPFLIQLNQELHSFIDKLREKEGIDLEKFESGVVKMINPYKFYSDKIQNFWISDIFEDNSLNILSSSFFKSKINCYNSEENNIYLNNKLKYVASLVLGHEIGHFLQARNRFGFDFFDMDTNLNKKRNMMGAELEADFFSGFYLSHPQGLALKDSLTQKIADYIFSELGDKMNNITKLKEPHGNGNQRRRAFLFGCNLGKDLKYLKVDITTPRKLHEIFKKKYMESSLLKDEIDYLTN